MKINGIEGRVVRWLSDERNTIILLYLLSVGLGLASLTLYMTGTDGRVSRLEIGLLVASGAVIFYVVIASLANRPA